MRKVFLITTLTIACFFCANAQNFMNVKMSKAAVNAGDSINIDVTVTNFTLLIGTQFSINWDSTKFKFGKIINKISPAVLPGDADLGVPPVGIIKQGQITFSWTSTSAPASLPNDTRLFTLRLKAVGVECDSTAVVLSDKPTKSEYYDENFATFKPTSTPGQAKINGAACMNGGGGPTGNELVVKASTLTACPGAEICVPLTVTNFIDIGGAQSKLKWDPAVLKIKPVPPLKYDALPNNIYNNTQTGIGELNFVWITGAGGLTIANGDRLMEVCFDVIGPEGSMTTIDLVDKDGNTETEYTNNSTGNPVPYINMDGKVTVTCTAPKTLALSIAEVTAAPNDSIDVSFTVDNFIDIKAAQFAVTFDPNVLQFGRRYMDAVNGAGGALVAPGRYNYNFLISGTTTITLPNGSTLFKIRFKVAACQSGATTSLFSTVVVADQPGFLIEFIDKNTVKVPYTVKQGSVTAPCTDPIVTCKVLSSTNVPCKGLGTGAINVEVTNANGCLCVWKKDGINFGNPISTPNCNLANIGPGVYTLVITCDGAEKCSSTATITEPATAIDINANITNVTCNTLGAIALNVTGGTGNNYTYLWSANNATTKDLANLAANSYTVTVTDEAKCTASKSFTVIQLPTADLKVDPQVVNVKCFGFNTGSIKLVITGGCGPYDITWAGDAANKTDTRSNLAVGTYGVIVTDASVPSKSVALQINVTGPASDFTVTGEVTNSSGADGAIDVKVSATGGTGNKTFKWSDGNVITEDRTGLAPGTYTVIVTDANDCSKSSSFEVKIVVPNPDPTMGNVIVSSEALNAGYGVSCVNECDGVIAGNAGGGTPPYTIVLSGQASKTINLTAAGPFSFKDLCVGAYSVKLTDAKGVATAPVSINVTQPTAIAITREIKCADGVLPTGAISINVTGGAGSYNYKWSNNKDTKDIDNLQIGSYAVVVSDANGCQATLTNIRVNDCTNNGETCFEEFTNIITPNNDGINDFFLISCAPSTDNELFVYDRWGTLVYSQKNYDNLWNGVNLNGSTLPESAYLWVLIVKDSGVANVTYKGAVTILRSE